ncbi:Xylose operon regulatory protein [Limihaloglobus sulfuriphilus]|uniref:Xylose operon regulatory protein n=1 Tax=Limihaloglobus sulfuriphilus TaxID=1851148 RepID=A0A1Q2MAM9_9BACT|nr:XylR family transcriptional regulator [Limihaloglobus sulfuriphilus]AQQ69785.1 Xylose operon regulatory protein [Limihaloglobus sulfuriphilus]
MKHQKKIALLIETSTSYGRTLIRGILKYANAAASWVFYNEPRGFADALPEAAVHDFDGLIMRDTPDNMKLLRLGIPAVVSIRHEKSIKGVPNIVSDSRLIGEMAAHYMLEKGFENLAYCGFDNMPWSHERQEAFIQTLPRGKEIHCFQQKKISDYGKQMQELADWLKSLPKPAGLMACNDVNGASIIEAAKLADVKIPQEVSILGVNNDDMICEMVSPQLSSISLDIGRAGYEAAKTLDRMLTGRFNAVEDIIIKPIKVITRESTNIPLLRDPDVAAALHYITKNSRSHLQVNDVAANVGINRRSLERKFRKVLNRTVYDEIKRSRIELMSKMLKETDISISEIAYNMGFNDANHIARYFKLETGISPHKFRQIYSE